MKPNSSPYESLGRQLVAAAERRERLDRRDRRRHAWRLPAVAIAAALVLAGGAAAVAATGILEGSPVKPAPDAGPARGYGVPLARSGSLAVRVGDPSGGPPWGMRVLRTTRGELCVQVGRVEGDRLGELGIDGAFGDDGRLHALAADVLPPGPGASSAQVECVQSGRTLVAEYPDADRNAVQLLSMLPERGPRTIPARGDLRTLAYGLLGPRAVSVTFRTPTGLRTEAVSGPQGAFLIVEPAGFLRPAEKPSLGGSSVWGEASPHSVRVTGPSSGAIVAAATFRFGSRLCSQGTGAPVTAECPSRRPGPPLSAAPPKNLRETIGLKLLQQSPAACRAAYLRDPCYRAQLEFQAPYVVSSMGSEYDVQSFGTKCQTGGRPDGTWALERDVRAHERVSTASPGMFTLTPRCLAHEGFQVRYGRTYGMPEPLREPVILGAVELAQASAAKHR